MQSARCSWQILMKLEFSRQNFEKYSISNFMKIRSVGAELLHTDRQTWRKWQSHFAILCKRLQANAEHTAPLMYTRFLQFYTTKLSRPRNTGRFILKTTGLNLCSFTLNISIFTMRNRTRQSHTKWRLDGPGSDPGGDEIFRPSRPPWGPPSLL